MLIARILSILLTLLSCTGAVHAQQDAEVLLLIARPQMQDPMFAESVVLVTRHGRSRPMGVILNKPTSVTLAGKEKTPEDARPVFRGGPVSPQVMVYVFREEEPIQGSPNLLRLGNGLFMGMGEVAMRDLLSRKPGTPLKLFLGLSSWGHGQLENEIKRGGWLVLPVDAEVVMQTETGNMWKDLVARASQRQI